MKKKAYINEKIKKFNREIIVPGDKSISIRFVLLASQAIGKSVAYNILRSQDVLSALNSIKKLGIHYNLNKKYCEIYGRGFNGFSFKNNIKIDIVVAVTKLGNTIILDRLTGEPIFDFHKKKAPRSKIPGEKTSYYQPSLKIPEPFSKQVFKNGVQKTISKNNTFSKVLQNISNLKKLTGLDTLYSTKVGLNFNSLLKNLPFLSPLTTRKYVVLTLKPPFSKI